MKYLFVEGSLKKEESIMKISILFKDVETLATMP
jgi:hypothetical protein